MVPTIHGIPAPNFSGSLNLGGVVGPSQPFVFAEDFEDMDLEGSSIPFDPLAPAPPTFTSQPIPTNPNRTARDLFGPSRQAPEQPRPLSPRRSHLPNLRQNWMNVFVSVYECKEYSPPICSPLCPSTSHSYTDIVPIVPVSTPPLFMDRTTTFLIPYIYRVRACLDVEDELNLDAHAPRILYEASDVFMASVSFVMIVSADYNATNGCVKTQPNHGVHTMRLEHCRVLHFYSGCCMLVKKPSYSVLYPSISMLSIDQAKSFLLVV